MGITTSTEYLALLRQAKCLSRILAIVAQAPDIHGRTHTGLADAADQAHHSLDRLLVKLAQPLSTELSAPPPARRRHTVRPDYLRVIA
ncbi:MAG: hypothetical protein Q8L45_01680 [Xanthomonadaceae bacterium]|nr:hypothetical protein [Xanthomonadaceae bacterium]MDP2185029.1 hypothetical protein [Xanthomonadales bacterium]MDZ4114408.1 hypothetical protein [Xanthomonadaceae bacterium]